MKPHRYRAVLVCCLGLSSWASAQIVEISRDGTEAVLSWDGDGVLQFAPDVAGPWMNDVEASSPHRVAIGANRQCFRIFYPRGFRPALEPPGLAFAEPNASPSSVARRFTRAAGAQGFHLSEIGDEVLLHSGETRRTEVDLQIRGRGMDFIWARHYRSRHGPHTEQGNRWDFSYNLHVEGGGPHVKVFDGTGHSAHFVQQSDGSYLADQYFREGRFLASGAFVLTFADTGIWEFRPLDGRPAAGRISRIADRNGNELAFEYDSLGRLTTVTDTLSRNIQVAYNGAGFVESVTDFTGRQVRYEYYKEFEMGGSFGDLKSVRSPIVTNTPTQNNFPLGKITTYTYSEGYADERENHLLLSITDPKGQVKQAYTYQHNQSDLDFLRCRASRSGYNSNLIQYHYVSLETGAGNQFAAKKVIVNDRMGNVSEHFYDVGNRLVMLREYTGRSDPGLPTTETVNRPLNPLRAADPAFFERIWTWNKDSLLVRLVYPNGNSVSNVYESTLSPDAPRRARGNLRQSTRVPGPLGGDQATIVQSWTYDPRFGTDARYDPFARASKGFGFVTFEDGSGHTTQFGYDSRGNCTNVVHRIPTIVEDFEYNAFGQVAAHVLPDNGNGFRRRDMFFYHTGGPQAGYLQQTVLDFGPGGHNQTTSYTYDAVGNRLTVVDPAGNNSQVIYNALDQPVRAESRETVIPGGAGFRQATDYFYDANDNVVRVCESNADELGRPDAKNAYITQLMEYDVLDRLVRVCAESGSYDVPRTPPKLDCAGLPASEFVTTEYEYDANWNRLRVRFGEASEGRQPANVMSTVYDERDLPFRTIRAEGYAEQSSTQHDYDGNGNLIRTLEGLELQPRAALFTYDGFDRTKTAADAMGNTRILQYDSNGNLIRLQTEGETNDVPGSAGNIRLNEITNVFDAMDRLTRRDVAFFETASGLPIDDGYATSLYTYSPSSQLLTRTDDNKHTSIRAYDRLHRLSRARDSRSNDVFYAYDANSNPVSLTSVERSDLGNPDQTFTTRYVYDSRDRLVRVLDNVSNSVYYAYDSRNNLVLSTDPLGVETRMIYDGRGRQVVIIRDMNANGAREADQADIIVSNVWDDSSRLVARIDDSTNITAYVHDALNRLILQVLADGTGLTNTYDVHDNLRTLRDGNRNAVSLGYDLLNRVTNKTIVPGPSVWPDTTFEQFQYDGLSRLVRAEDDDSLVELAYNSLGSVLRHRLNGKTTTATYDGVGNTVRCIYPGGRTVGYSYDALDRIQAGLDGSGTVQSTYDFIGPDRMERMDYPNRTRIEYFYDGITGVPNGPGDFGVKQRVRTLHSVPATGAIIDDRSYRWDRRYSKTARIDQRTTGLAWRHDYAYDAEGRLSLAEVTAPPAVPLRQTRYSYDGVGNRAAVTNNGVTELYHMDATVPQPADSQVNQYTATPFDTRAYDANGNLTVMNPGGRSERLLFFDYADRLVRLIDSANNVTNDYAYDALGRRIAKIVRANASPPNFTYNHYGADWSSHANLLQVVEEQDQFGVTLATFVYGGGLDDVMHMRRGDTDYHFHHDDLGNVTAVTDASGLVVERYEYGDFGQPQFFDEMGTPITESAIGNPYLFTGRRYDPETGLYYFRNRYLDPRGGRFITRDPLGTWGDAANHGNALAYVGNNPWTHTDPLGLAKERFVRSKPHVNIGTIGHVNRSAAAATKPKEIVVVGSKPLRKQGLYFPETMLKEIANGASTHRGGHAHGHLDFLKMVGDPATAFGDTTTHEVGHWLGLYHGGSSGVDARDYAVWRSNYGASHSAGTHEVGHWLGLDHHAHSNSGDGDVDGRDFLVWQRGLASSDTAASHPDFLWAPIHVSTDGAILVVSALDGPMPYPVPIKGLFALKRNLNPFAPAAACLDFPIPCPTCPGGYHMKTICPGGGGGDPGGTLVLGGIED